MFRYCQQFPKGKTRHIVYLFTIQLLFIFHFFIFLFSYIVVSSHPTNLSLSLRVNALYSSYIQWVLHKNRWIDIPDFFFYAQLATYLCKHFGAYFKMDWLFWHLKKKYIFFVEKTFTSYASFFFLLWFILSSCQPLGVKTTLVSMYFFFFLLI